MGKVLTLSIVLAVIGFDTSLARSQPQDSDPALDARLAFEGPSDKPQTHAFEEPAFGRRGDRHWVITTGAAIGLENTEEATDIPVNIAYSTFVADSVEFTLDLTLWAHVQDGDDAFGVNPGFNIRWHYINRDDWTLFAETGIGLLFTTDDVPDRGTSFNFTPRVGLGGTVRLNDAGVRLIGGVRWHHISNARIEGEERNPDRDGVLIHAGVMIPF